MRAALQTRFFFEPVKFNLELAYLAVELFLQLFVSLGRLLFLAVKDRNQMLLSLALPSRYLVRVDTVQSGKLIDGLVTP